MPTLFSLAAELAAAIGEGIHADRAQDWMIDAVLSSTLVRQRDAWAWSAVPRVAAAMAATNPTATDMDWEGNDACDALVDRDTTALCHWLASAPHRPRYCDDAVTAYGKHPLGIARQIQMGQHAEYLEIWTALAAFLAERAKALTT